MAVAVVMDFNGATLEQYDQVIEKMHLTPGCAGPARRPVPLVHRDRQRHPGHRRLADPRAVRRLRAEPRSGRRPPRSGFRGRRTSRSTTSTVISLRVGPDVTLRIPPWGPIPEHAPRGARPAAGERRRPGASGDVVPHRPRRGAARQSGAGGERSWAGTATGCSRGSSTWPAARRSWCRCDNGSASSCTGRARDGVRVGLNVPFYPAGSPRSMRSSPPTSPGSSPASASRRAACRCDGPHWTASPAVRRPQLRHRAVHLDAVHHPRRRPPHCARYGASSARAARCTSSSTAWHPTRTCGVWQHRLEPLQKRLVGGCHLTRSVVDLLTGARASPSPSSTSSTRRAHPRPWAPTPSAPRSLADPGPACPRVHPRRPR